MLASIAQQRHSSRPQRSHLVRFVKAIWSRRSVRRSVAVAVAASAVLAGTAESASAAVTTVTVPVYNYKTVDERAHKVIAVQNASPANLAAVIQHTYSVAEPNNDLMVLENEVGTYLYRIKPRHTYTPDGNPHNDKCLAIYNADDGNDRPIVSANCSYDHVNNDVWVREPAKYYDSSGTLIFVNGAAQFRNQMTGECLVTRGGSIANNARLATWSCNGTFNSFWKW
jgi:hypothetical protein